MACNREKPLLKSSSLNQDWLETTLHPNLHQSQRSSVPNIHSNQQALSNRHKFLFRDGSVQTDESLCSSLESVLELRKPDPEQVLLDLGFGPKDSASRLSRIPSRFLQPSKLIPQIDINKFLEEYLNGSTDSRSGSVPTSPSKVRTKST